MNKFFVLDSEKRPIGKIIIHDGKASIRWVGTYQPTKRIPAENDGELTAAAWLMVHDPCVMSAKTRGGYIVLKA